MKLIDLLIQRKDLAEKFTKQFHDRVKSDLKYYEADQPSILETLNIDLIDPPNRRYMFVIPLVYTQHESMLASMFDRVPELVFHQGGEDDAGKKEKVEAAYEYLKKKLDLETFMNDAAWWYVLSGFVSSHASYMVRSKDVPIYDEATGEPMVDVDGKQMMRTEYIYDDPVLEVGDPLKDVFAPESEYSIEADEVPYYCRPKLLRVDEVKEKYGKDVEPDASIDSEDGEMGKESKVKSDVERVKTWFYYGQLPKSVKGEIRGWNKDTYYYVVFTQKTILFKASIEEYLGVAGPTCRLLKWNGAPNKFFGFGLGKLLMNFQREKSIRRGQMVRYADVAAFPKVTAKTSSKIDQKALKDPRELPVLLYDDDKPEYMQPPQINQIVGDTLNLADQDAQQTTGLMDLSQGAQESSTVKTATGQTIFADAAEKRVRKAKRKFFQFYKSVVIQLLKLCQANWNSEKLIYIMGDDGSSRRVSVSSDDLLDIDFDTDVDIDAESVSINKDVLREQAIALYDKVKDDPLVNRKEVFRHMLETGFLVKNSERFTKDQEIEPGMVLINPETGEQYVVDETGELVLQESMDQTAQPSGEPVPSSQSGIMGGVQ